MAPKTQYANSAGANIAYQVEGEGPVDLVIVPGFISNVELWWTWPEIAAFAKRMASFARLITFDKRGTGLSDPAPGAPPLEERMEDLHAVLDAAGSEKAALFGVSEGGPMSALFAATYPDRVSHLILFGSFPNGGVVLENDFARSLREANGISGPEEMIDLWMEHWGEGVTVDFFAPEQAGNPALRKAFGAFERFGASPGMARSVIEALGEIDVTSILPSIATPTRVIHRVGDRVAPIESGRLLAEKIPGAELIELPGNDHPPWFGDFNAICDHVERFVTGAASTTSAERVLATVMFTDIVGSTERAGELGDARWRELLGRHDEIVQAAVTAADGRVVKSTGDGHLMTFDGPARAIRTARTLRDELSGVGLQIRAGIHTGECEIVGDDVAGMAVHIAARVAGAAEAGEVMVSSSVRDLVVGSELTFEDRGRHELKGVPGKWSLLAVAGDRTREPATGDSEAAPVRKRGDRAFKAMARNAPGLTRALFRVSRRTGELRKAPNV